MTALTDCHSPSFVIPTEKPLGFDEESPVYTTQSSEAQNTYSRSSRCFAPQDDSINGLITPLSITGLEDCNFEIYITILLRMTDLGELLFP